MELSFGVLLMSTALTFADAEETTQEFSCCHLPFEIQINRTYVHELSIGNESLVRGTVSTLDVMPPFAAQGNEMVTLPKCVDFEQKIVFVDEHGFTKEKRIQNLSQPCNSTGSHINIYIGVGVGLLVLAGITGGIVYKRVCNRENNNSLI